MLLYCHFCQQTFNAAFGPPIARCPTCRGQDVRHAEAQFAEAAQAPYRTDPSSVFQPTEASPDSLPSHVISITPWIAGAICVTLFCQPIGLVGLYFADRAKNLARNGNLTEAHEKLTYSKVAVISGLVIIALAVFALIIAGVQGKL